MDNILSHIQTHLKAPKNQRNTFGNYNYRNCEDILEAVKPFLEESGTALLIWDDIVLVGERYYIKATARLIHGDKQLGEVSAFARESEEEKGMKAPQNTGSSSSYARKYALNGLFAIDDTKDADTTNKGNDTTKTKPSPNEKEPRTDAQWKRFWVITKKHSKSQNREMNKEEATDFTTWLKTKVQTVEIRGESKITKQAMSALFDNKDEELISQWDTFAAEYLNPPF